MKHKSILITVSIAVSPAIISAIALSDTQDKYSVKVPNGLGFSDFKGYESWQLIAVSHSGDKLDAVLGDPSTVDAYKAGIPDNGKPFPDGTSSQSSALCTLPGRSFASTQSPSPLNINSG